MFDRRVDQIPKLADAQDLGQNVRIGCCRQPQFIIAFAQSFERADEEIARMVELLDVVLDIDVQGYQHDALDDFLRQHALHAREVDHPVVVLLRGAGRRGQRQDCHAQQREQARADLLMTSSHCTLPLWIYCLARPGPAALRSRIPELVSSVVRPSACRRCWTGKHPSGGGRANSVGSLTPRTSLTAFTSARM